MPYLVGTDEAGYGPNLGPLVVSCTVWHVSDGPDGEDLYRRLRRVVCKSPSKNGAARRLPIADSKALYSPAQGLAQLELGVLAALALLDHWPAEWREIWTLLDRGASDHLASVPWHEGYDSPLPWAADREELVRAAGRLRRGCEAAGVRLVAIYSTGVFPARFNALTAECGNKAEALSKITLELAGRALEHCIDEPVLVVCDKHGGRNRYSRLLQEQFPDPLVEVHGEGLAESIYRWGPSERRTEFRFRSKGERFLPAALASMVAKYLRELAMRPFNEFWCTRLPELRPTAGYPLDARRFKQAIATLQSQLGIDDHVLWRSR